MVANEAKTNRLGYQLFALLIAASAALSLVSAAVQLALEYRWSLTTIDHQLKQIEQSYKGTFANSLWSFDERQIQYQLLGILQLPDVQMVEVRTTYGETYLVGRPPKEGEQTRVRKFRLSEQNGQVTVLGDVTVVSTLTGLHDRLRRRFLVILAAQAAQIFLAALFLFFVFQFLVTRHLSTMAAYARSLRLDGLDEPLTLREGRWTHLAPDELDAVARALNEMRESLRAQISRRRRVDARVAFLAEASKRLAASLDPQNVADCVCQLAVPKLASLALCFVVDPAGALVLTSVAGSSEEKAKATRRYFQGATDPHELSVLLQTFRGSSISSIPLEAHDRPLGALLLLRDEHECESPDVDPAEKKLLSEFALRASSALDNATLYRDAQNIITLRDEFLTVASHELNTPLTTLKLYVQRLGKLRADVIAGARSPERVERTLEQVERQVDRLQRLIASIVDVTELQSGRLKLHHEPCDLAELAREALVRDAGSARRAGCTLELNAEEGVIGEWDPRYIQQLLSSLLSNALKFGAGLPVEIKVARVDGRGVLTVKDQGLGISPEDQRRIFERFSRAVSHHHFGGMGLGLYIAQQIVEVHGGSIQVESQVGLGSTFRVTLPLTPMRPAATEDTQPAYA